jgi:hypothetical protein
MDKIPFIFSTEHFQNFVTLLKKLIEQKYDKSSAKVLESKVDNKVDKIEGKNLSTEDFTTQDKTRLNNTVTSIYYKDESNKLEIDNGAVIIPGISSEDLPEIPDIPTELKNPYPINIYNDANTSNSDQSSAPAVSYDGSTIQSLTAHSFFNTAVIKIAATSWSSKEYVAAIPNLHVDSIVFVSPTPYYMNAYAEYGLKAERKYNGQLHFSCLQTPSEDINVYVIYSSPPREANGTIYSS